MRSRPWIDDELAGYPETGNDVVRQVRFQFEDRAPVYCLDVCDPVGAGLVHQRGELRGLRLVPRKHQRAGADDRQVEAFMDVQILAVAVTDARQFQRAFRRIETGMQDGAVALRGAVEHVGGLLQHHHARTVERKPSGDGTAHDARADHGDIEGIMLACAHCSTGKRAGSKMWFRPNIDCSVEYVKLSSAMRLTGHGVCDDNETSREATADRRLDTPRR